MSDGWVRQADMAERHRGIISMNCLCECSQSVDAWALGILSSRSLLWPEEKRSASLGSFEGGELGDP